MTHIPSLDELRERAADAAMIDPVPALVRACFGALVLCNTLGHGRDRISYNGSDVASFRVSDKLREALHLVPNWDKHINNPQ